MMSLLSVTVKKARYVGAQASQFNTYVTLKLQNVKSTTVTVKGATPCWEQDFLFETNDLNTGLLIEVWSKGMIWDRAMGYHWIPLQAVHYANEEGNGQWLSLEAELVMRDGEVVGTKNPTGHSLLVDCRFELPFDPENIEASDLQRKLEMLNNIMDQEARAEQARRQMQYFGHSYSNHFDNEISAGYSEDSDYTSDLNYPVGQHANSSASQFRSAAHQINTPQRSLETSRENSYERDDAPGSGGQHHLSTPMTHQHHLSPGGTHRRHNQRYSPNTDDYGYGSTNVGQNVRQYQDNNVDSDPLFYNSRPRNKPEYSSQDTWVSCESSFYNQQSIDGVDGSYPIDSNYYGSQPPAIKSKALRRPSLERQTTLYDDSTFYGDANYYPAQESQVNYVDISIPTFNKSQSYDEYYDTSSYPFQEERYGQDEEDRQWDSGGLYNTTKTTTKKQLPAIPTNYANKRCSSALNYYETYPGYDDNFRCAPTPTRRRKMPQIPTKRSTSRQSSFNDKENYDGFRTPESRSTRGASLPPTPTKTPKILQRITNNNKPFNSLPATPGRQLPKPNVNHRSAMARRNSLMKRTNSAEYSESMMDTYDNYYMRPGAVSAREVYNEDYNYAYQSIDNLQEQQEDLDATPTQNFISDNRTSTNVDINYKNDYYQQQQQQTQEDYYYNAQQEKQYNDTGYYEEPNTQVSSRRKKLLGSRRENNQLLQQNTDSLESRDDDLKDSFETAISSISTSVHRSYGDYSTAAETTITNTAPSIVEQVGVIPKPTIPEVQYKGDQTELTQQKAIENLPTEINGYYNTEPQNNTSFRNNSINRGYLKQQESIQSYYEPETAETTNIDYKDTMEPYLAHMESVESYTEEGMVSNGVTVDYNNKAINQDSPQSVIHVDNYEDQNLRRGSSQLTVVDPYHPSQQRQVTDPYAPVASRRSSAIDPYQTNGRRVSGDSYQSPSFNNDPYLHKSSVVDAYPSTIPSRRGSVRVSPSPPKIEEVEEIQERQTPVEEGTPEKKSVSFEEEEEQKPQRPQVTAQQRWLWAYNKIIMQLNTDGLKIRDISWKKCQNTKYAMEVEKLNISLHGREFTLKANVEISDEIQEPIKVETELEKSIFGIWVNIPCENDIGTCTFEDVCKKFGVPEDRPCPPEFEQNGVPCRCPLPKKSFLFSKKYKTDGNEPPQILGKYKGRFLATKENVISCYNLSFTLV